MNKFFITNHVTGPVAGHFTIVEIQQTCDGSRWRFTERHYRTIEQAEEAVKKLENNE